VNRSRKSVELFTFTRAELVIARYLCSWAQQHDRVPHGKTRDWSAMINRLNDELRKRDEHLCYLWTIGAQLPTIERGFRVHHFTAILNRIIERQPF